MKLRTVCDYIKFRLKIRITKNRIKHSTINKILKESHSSTTLVELSRGTAAVNPSTMPLSGSVAKPHGLSAHQSRLRARLTSGHFRMLNESLYTQTGAASRRLLTSNPALFDVYHRGYAEQVRRWPTNPLDDVIAFVKGVGAGVRVADLGCGEGRLAKECTGDVDVRSFDLVAAEGVTACDIAHVPLAAGSMDIAVFCLSLMGTNYADFLREARRILIPGGLLLVVEVASRFQGHEPREFVGGVEGLGFTEDSQCAFVQRAVGGAGGKTGKRAKKGKKAKAKGKGSAPPSAFFYKFAFRSTKGEDDAMDGKGKKGKRAAQLPPLIACVYKKR